MKLSRILSESAKLNTVEMYNDTYKTSFGTFEDTKEHFKSLDIKEKDKFASILLKNMNDISDYINVSWYMGQRVADITNKIKYS